MIDLDVTRITALQLVGFIRAQAAVNEGMSDMTRCPSIIRKGNGGGGWNMRFVGKQCVRKAGQGTWHEGYGRCVAHGGAKREGRAEGAWLMAFAYAQEYDLSPWESLLYVIRITAGRVRYCEQVLATAHSDKELEGRVKEGDPLGVGEDGELSEGRNLSWWVDTSERERMMLAKVSKAAIDAGVAQLLVEQTLREGNQLADGYLAVWEDLRERGLSKEGLDMVLASMKMQLASMDAGSVGGFTTNVPTGQYAVEGSVIKSTQEQNEPDGSNDKTKDE